MSDTIYTPEVRQQFVDLALGAEGLGAFSTTREAYLDLLATCATDRADPRVCAELAVMSSCALVVRGLWWRAGIRHPILSLPYVIGHAVSDVIEIAQACSALRPRSYVARPGDVVIIDAPVHVFTVIESTDDGVLSIDGGQRDKNRLECIARRDRIYVAGSAPTLGGRPIVHVIDCVALAAAESW